MPEGAILQRDKKTYAIVPRTPCGILSLDVLKAIVHAAEKYEIPILKITSGQRIALVGVTAEQVDQIWADLKTEVGRAMELCLHYVQACPGTTVCKLGVQDSIGLGMEIDEQFKGEDMPAKLKFGVSGCPLCCAESFVRDVGLVGKKDGWTMAVGGYAGGKPVTAQMVAEGMDREAALEAVGKFVAYYQTEGKKKERTNRFVARVGIDAVKKKVLG